LPAGITVNFQVAYGDGRYQRTRSGFLDAAVDRADESTDGVIRRGSIRVFTIRSSRGQQEIDFLGAMAGEVMKWNGLALTVKN